jgi:hypothetical protein
MKLSKDNVFMVVDHAKNEMRRMPGRVIIDGKTLSQSDVIGLAYFHAVCRVLSGLGVDTSSVEIAYDDDSDFSLDEYQSDRFSGTKE